MNKTLLISALFAAFAITACDKPTVVNVPVPVAVPGPAGPTGATGATGGQGVDGNTGNTGATGKPGEGTNTTVIVMPAASAASN